jgi:cell wall-associated NlpC family hydrolase
VTTDTLTSGLPAATRPARRTGVLQFLCALALCVAASSAFAQDAQVVLTPDASQNASAKPSPLKVRPIFGDIAELDGASAASDQPAKPKLTERISNIMSKAMTLLGTPYRWGGESQEDGGFDCSGLVGYVYRSVLGMDLPRVSRQMANTGQAVDRASLVPGDLVFFGLRGRVNHVGIYMGEGRFLHAPSRGKVVRVDSLSSSYWSGRYLEGRRVAM